MKYKGNIGVFCLDIVAIVTHSSFLHPVYVLFRSISAFLIFCLSVVAEGSESYKASRSLHHFPAIMLECSTVPHIII